MGFLGIQYAEVVSIPLLWESSGTVQLAQGSTDVPQGHTAEI